MPVPAPAFFEGIKDIAGYEAQGQKTYLLGKISYAGWWYFFPVALAVKTPLPFLILTGVGFVFLMRDARISRRRPSWRVLAPAVSSVVVLLVCIPSRIQLGLRHILPIYPLLAAVAGYGGAKLLCVIRPRLVGLSLVGALLSWQAFSCARVRPEYLAYFNELPSRHPERFLVHSDLDWGQDLLRLAKVVRARGIKRLSLAYYGDAEIRPEDFPDVQVHPLAPYERATGWIAVSIGRLTMGWAHHYDAYSWLAHDKPVANAGRSIRLYYIPPTAR